MSEIEIVNGIPKGMVLGWWSTRNLTRSPICSRKVDATVGNVDEMAERPGWRGMGFGPVICQQGLHCCPLLVDLPWHGYGRHVFAVGVFGGEAYSMSKAVGRYRVYYWHTKLSLPIEQLTYSQIVRELRASDAPMTAKGRVSRAKLEYDVYLK